VRIKGQCHCQNIAFSLAWPENVPVVAARACDCSFCSAHGNIWAAHPKAVLSLQIKDGKALSSYQFATRTATFLVCKVCGIVPVVISEINGNRYAVVNTNTFADFGRDRMTLSTLHLGDETFEARLARRANNWIATLEDLR
jgi:hypothetical protein